ncbi:MAG: methionine gamma-lyase family protein, partial [Clostridiales bacterium]|nr:methionine gamma-lyase family protein [Clostridiales bacterium]
MNFDAPLPFSQRVLELSGLAQQDIAGQFASIDAIAEYNTRKVLSAFQNHRVAEGYFAGTTGYGYDDQGRDELEKIYA